MIDATAQHLERDGQVESTGRVTAALPPVDVDPEVLHRLRITLRRLRAVWSTYARQLDKGMTSRERALYRYLAAAVGKTRDWDVLITLLSAPGAAGASSVTGNTAPGGANQPTGAGRPTSSHTDIRAMLHDAVRAARVELDGMSLHASGRRGTGSYTNRESGELRARGTSRASYDRRAGHAAFNNMRRAGARLDYLIDFFRPVLVCHERDVARNLRRIRKRFGKLNDVVACEALLRENPALLPDDDATRRVLASLQRERRRRMRAASRLLTKC